MFGIFCTINIQKCFEAYNKWEEMLYLTILIPKKSLDMVSFRGVKSPKSKCDHKCTVGGGGQRLRNFVPKKIILAASLVQFSTPYFWKNSMSIIHRQHKRRFKVLHWWVGICLIWTCIKLQSKRRHFPTKIHSMFGANFSWEIAISSPVLTLLHMIFFNFGPRK